MTEMKSNSVKKTKPSFFRRIQIAFGAFFRTFSDVDYADRIDHLRQPEEPVSAPPPAPEVPPPLPQLKEASPDSALQLLGLLQRDARLIDFTMENLTTYTDAEIGAAARVVHEGCRKVLNEHFSIVPVREEAEGSRVTLNEGFDAASISLTGNVVGSAPFHGSLTHRGWRAKETRLPKLAEHHDASVIAPAEVEL